VLYLDAKIPSYTNSEHYQNSFELNKEYLRKFLEDI